MLQIYVYGLQSCMGCYFVWAVIYRFINSIKEKKDAEFRKRRPKLNWTKCIWTLKGQGPNYNDNFFSKIILEVAINRLRPQKKPNKKKPK